jgi:flagellin FlaB
LLRRDQRGITGLETAIVLIAFVVVSSVFAFAALSTGLFSSDKAKETIQAGLAETRGSMELKGSVILTSSTTGTSGVVSDISFQVANAAGGEALDLTPGKTIVKYTDPTQSKIFESTTGFTVTALGNADADKLLERNEVFEIQLIDLETTGVGNDTLTNQLMTSRKFSIEVIPPTGAVLFIERITPVFLNTTTSLH